MSHKIEEDKAKNYEDQQELGTFNSLISIIRTTTNATLTAITVPAIPSFKPSNTCLLYSIIIILSIDSILKPSISTSNHRIRRTDSNHLNIRASSTNPQTITNFFNSNQSLPNFALEFAPLVYLHSQETFWPSNLDQHIQNVQPEINFTVVQSYQALNQDTQDYLSSDNLKRINADDQSATYLTSIQPIFDPNTSSWLKGVGPPDSKGKSAASAIIIAVDKTLQVGPGWVDVFYLFFYSYNRGNYFYNNRFGDHVGDWENTMIRFYNGLPKYVTPEAHGGQVMLGNSAFDYEVLERVNGRPIVYSANGTHGMYPQAGEQNYTGLPVPIYDVTDRGHLWDPTQNYKPYFFSNEQGFTYTADTPIDQQDPQGLGWLTFLGYWGDQKYEKSNPHQTCISNMCFYDSGPLGPQAKSLGRGWICGNSDCKPQSSLPIIVQAGAPRYNSPFSSSNRLKTAPDIISILSLSLLMVYYV